MNPTEKDLLEKTYELSKENNKILRGIRSSNRWSLAFQVFYWIVIVGISIGAFYYLQPYLDIAFKTYKNIQGDLNNVNSLVKSLPKSL